MSYAVFVNHPETWQRREANFPAWDIWSRKNAPWTGVGIDEEARILQAVCADSPSQACAALDSGGDLDPDATRGVLRLAEGVMGPETLEVYRRAVQDGHGVRIVFSQALGSAVSASAYLAKFGSA